MKTIVSLAVILIALAFVGVAVLTHRKKHWIYALSHVAVVVISAALGVLLANLAGGALVSVGLALLKNTDFWSTVEELLTEIPSLQDAAEALVRCVVAPVLFLPIFLILRGILNRVAKPVSRAIISATLRKAPAAEALAEEQNGSAVEETAGEVLAEGAEGDAVAEEPMLSEKAQAKQAKKAKKLAKKQLLRTEKASGLGMACGAVCGLLLFVALAAPTVGFLNICDDAMSFVATEDDNAVMKITTEALDAGANNVGSQAVRYLGGQPIFAGLTSYRVGGHVMSLTKETRFLASMGSAALAINDDSVSPAEAANRFRKTGEAFRKTDLLPVLLPELCHAATEDWNGGRDFHGISKPSFGETLDVFVTPFLDVMAVSDYDTIKEDVNTLFDLMAEAVEAEALQQMAHPLSLFEKEEFTASMLKTLLENPRLSGMVGGFLDFGVRTFGDSMGMYADESDLYRTWLYQMYEITEMTMWEQEWEALPGTLIEQYRSAFADFGLELDASAAETLVASVLAFNGDLSPERLGELFDSTAVLNGNGESIFLNRETVAAESLLIPANEFSFDVGRIIDRDAEAHAMAKVLSEMAALMGTTGDTSVSSTVASVGKVLDALANTQMVGKEQTAKLLTAILQTEGICDNLGISVREATDLAQTLAQNAEKKGYAVLMASLGETVRVLADSSDSSTSMNDRVQTLMETMTPESARVLQSFVNPNVMVANGVPESGAAAAADLMSTMFGNLADMGEGMSAEDYQNESQAVTTVVNLAMNAGSSQSSSMFGEGSVTGMSASEYTSCVLNSAVVSQTMCDVTYGESGEPTTDPLNTGVSLSEQEEGELIQALNENWVNEANQNDEATRQKYVAAGALVNLNIVVTDAGISVAA